MPLLAVGRPWTDTRRSRLAHGDRRGLAGLSGGDEVLVAHLFEGIGDFKHPGEHRPGTRMIRGRSYVPDSG